MGIEQRGMRVASLHVQFVYAWPRAIKAMFPNKTTPYSITAANRLAAGLGVMINAFLILNKQSAELTGKFSLSNS